MKEVAEKIFYKTFNCAGVFLLSLILVIVLPFYMHYSEIVLDMKRGRSTTPIAPVVIYKQKYF